MNASNTLETFLRGFFAMACFDTFRGFLHYSGKQESIRGGLIRIIRSFWNGRDQEEVGGRTEGLKLEGDTKNVVETLNLSSSLCCAPT